VGKIVAMINEDKDLEEICIRINQRKHFSQKKIKDFEKQLQQAQEELQKNNEADWEILKDWLSNKDRLPTDYNDQTHNIGFSLKNNGIHVARNDEEDERGDMPFPGKIKNMGAFRMEDLPPEVRDAMKQFIEGQLDNEDEDD